MSEKNGLYDIIQDLNLYSNRIAKYMAIETRDILAEETRLAIEAFYDDYRPGADGEPLYYLRDYKNFRKKSYTKYYDDKNGKYSGGVEFLPEEMDEIYHNDAEYVWKSVMFLGRHGTKTLIPPMKVTPIRRIISAKRNIIRYVDDYTDKAIAKAQKDGGYKTLSF